MNDPISMLRQLQSNPIQMLMQRGMNVPQNMNNPQQIIQHLMNTGQISQEQYNWAVKMANSFKR